MDSSKLDLIREDIIAFFLKADADQVSVKFETPYGKLGEKEENSICRVNVRRNYDLGKITSFANMAWLSGLLHTDEINLENEYHVGGCDSCDYGSYTEVDFVCLNINPFDE